MHLCTKDTYKHVRSHTDHQSPDLEVIPTSNHSKRINDNGTQYGNEINLRNMMLNRRSQTQESIA